MRAPADPRQQRSTVVQSAVVLPAVMLFAVVLPVVMLFAVVLPAVMLTVVAPAVVVSARRPPRAAAVLTIGDITLTLSRALPSGALTSVLSAP
ncbi:hypothetical protein [Streptomyces sp. NPDC101393]|uniref:hypothetical protein n=1 Tax=Streptomyces sp. NPDC101393 TaxID=3366141 RepID=UPI0037F9B7DE